MQLAKFLSRCALVALAGSGIISANAAPSSNTGMFGSPAQVNGMQRTVILDRDYVDVVQGESVKFVTTQGQTFAWTFDTWTTNTFKLSEIAPSNAYIGNVQVYVKPNPLYRGGSN